MPPWWDGELTEQRYHINFLEFTVAFLALQSVCSASKDIAVLLCLDNLSTVSFLNRMGESLPTPFYPDLGVVYQEEHLYSPTRSAECPSRLGELPYEGFQQLEAQQSSVFGGAGEASLTPRPQGSGDTQYNSWQ